MFDRALCRIAAFDFDGTLTHKETLSRFLFFGLPLSGVVRGCIRWIPCLLKRWVFSPSRDAFKEASLSAFLKGYSRVDLEYLGSRYAQQHLPQWINPCMWRVLLGELQQSQELWIVSGSLSLYLRPFFASLPLTGVIACELSFDSQGICLGTLQGGNCWGKNKIAQLRASTNLDRSWLVAYGNSLGDQELLDAAWESHWL